MIKRVGVVTVHVYDQDAAIDFYTNKLGMTLVTDNDMGDGTRWVVVKPSDGETTITLYKLPDHEPGQFPIGSHHPIVLVVDDLERTYEELVERGVEFSHPPFDSGSDAKSAMFLDADKNELILTDARS
ncbi:MAG: VOC family protein [Thermomicrobiales bacterium]